MDINKKKILAAKFSIISNIFLTALKIIAGIISGSISVISEAIHSMSDFFASIITFFSVMKSSQPADEDHPYGHGRYEDMSGFVEGFLIILAALFIIYKSAKKIIIGAPPESESILGIIVMSVAVIVNIFVSSYLFKVAKESNSISLYADGEHLRTDVYSSFGVLLGLVLIKYTGHYMLDPIMAILVAVLIYKTGWVLFKRALMNLLDHSLPEEDIEQIKNIISEFKGQVLLKENSIKARQMGPTKDIDMILQFPENTPICVCHKICDEVENKIQKIYINSSISIHSEPMCYKKNCMFFCTKECSLAKH